MQTSTVAVGTTPIVFVSTCGTAAVTAGGSIRSSTASPSSRITASTAVLTAGRPLTGAADNASLIDVNSAVGRVTAASPAAITLRDSGAIDLLDVQTLVDGAVTVDAQGTITARYVSTAGGAGTPADVNLTSFYGDVVAATVTSAIGTIDLTSVNERVVLRRVGLNDPVVTAEDGDVIAMANARGIVVEGSVLAGGTDGDITFQSNLAGLSLVTPADIEATDRLTVTTPAAVASLGAGVTVSAAAVSFTAQLGPAQSLPTGFGSFSALDLNRTDPGDIVVTSPVGLTVEGATAVLGSITLTAPSLDVIGNVTAGTAAPGDGNVELVATSGNIVLAAPVSAPGDRVTLNASAGVISQTAGQIDAPALVWYATVSPFPGLTGTFTRLGSNLTAPGNLTLGTPNAPIVIVGASTVSGRIDIVGSSVQIVDVVKANTGDPVSVTATAGNIEFVAGTRGRIFTLPAGTSPGSVSLAATAGSVLALNSGTLTAVRSGTLSIVAQAADMKCNVSSLDATTTLGGLTVSALEGLPLAGIAAAGQSVTLNAVSGVSQVAGGIVAATLSVTNGSGTVNLGSTTNAVSNVAITNGSGNVSLTNSGSFAVGAPGVSSGSAAAGDGSIALSALTGTISLIAPVSAGGDRVTLDARSGSILGSGDISADSLVWYATTQPSLPGAYTGLGSNLTGPGSLTLNVASTQSVLATSTVNGSITITGPTVVIREAVTAGGAGSGIAVSATGGNVALKSVVGSAPSLSVPNGVMSLSATGLVNTSPGSVAANSVVIASGGTVHVGRVTAATTMSVTTTTPAGGVDVGMRPGSLLQSGGALDLRNVQGPIVIRNGGSIVGNPLLLAPGKTIQFGGAITTVGDLNNVINAVNQLPATPGVTYDVLVGASMTLTQTLTVTRPVTFRGTSTSIVLSGSPSVTSGLVLAAGAGGSNVRNITFSNFSADAIRATSVSGLSINGVKSMNSGTGIRLSSVTSSTIGGTAAGQGNVLQNCRTGIYAAGICTNTKLVKNTFPGTTTKYNVSTSRGITVVN
jgi:hypothetical protein